jgi:hypothetical protein
MRREACLQDATEVIEINAKSVVLSAHARRQPGWGSKIGTRYFIGSVTMQTGPSSTIAIRKP